jgi:hypothetical protein
VNLDAVTRLEAVEGGSDGEGSIDLDHIQPGKYRDTFERICREAGRDPREFVMMANRKKARTGGFENKGDILAHLNLTFRMHLGVAAGCRDPEVQEACAFLTQKAEQVQANAMTLFTESMAACRDEDIEKIIAVAGQTNNILKYDTISRTTMKQVFDMVQSKEMQLNSLKQAANLLAQLIVTGAFTSETGTTSWTGTEGFTVQSVSSHVLKEKCKHAGAAAANAAAGRG